MNIGNVKLGLKYEDIITGFVGVCTGKVVYISGCDQALLTPRAGKDGKPAESNWYDVQRLKEVRGQKITLQNEGTPGFDKPAPIR